MTQIEFGQKIKQTRIDAGYSIGEMCKFMGMNSRSGLVRVENGSTPLPSRYVRAFCYWTGLPMKIIVSWYDLVYRLNLFSEIYSVPDPSFERD